ncbi:transcription antitermination protein nusG [Armatimonadetes bacterium GXS]|nr:transcription antitermination protein nusG [Armatimonadetes bacterium GXS]
MRRAWYVVRTLVGKENQVKTAIEKRAQAAGMTDRIFQVLIPTEQEVRTKGGQKQTVTRKVFPGYVLVEMILDDETRTLVRSTPSVTGFVESGGKPVPLSPEEVEEIQRSIVESKERPRIFFSPGDTVRVNEGPFADFTGKVESIDAERSKVKVLINIFGRETPVELEVDQVEKVT